VSAADVGIQLSDGARPREAAPEHAGAGPGSRPGDEQVPPPGGDATLLAVVPIPGTGTSLAIVGYVIATSGPGPAVPGPGRAPGPGHDAGPGRAPTADDGLRLDYAQRRVSIEGREVQLTFQEFELLAYLTAHPATVFTRAELVERVWHRSLGQDGRPMAQDSRTVDVHVSRVRRKLGVRYGQCLVTEYRVGYQYRPLAS
jgi:hypothetical protein